MPGVYDDLDVAVSFHAIRLGGRGVTSSGGRSNAATSQ